MTRLSLISLTWLLFLIWTISLDAQPLTSSTALVDVGTVVVGETDSVQLTLTNPTTDTVEVSEIKFYSIYDSLIYRASETSLSLQPGAQTTLWVYFSPEHNIQHPSQMVLITDSHRGSLSLSLAGQGTFANTYYASTQNLHEQALKNALKTRLAQGFQQQSYNAARDAMYMTIDNRKVNGQGASVNTLVGVYTGFTVTNYTSRTDAQLQGFNTEHTFPQGFFSQNLPMRSDIHHLFPTKIAANSARANLPFGNVSNPTWQDGGSKHNGARFEPRDDHKGAVARCMFYFVLRYQNYQNFLTSQEAVLRQWHSQFPPTAQEITRNSDIFGVQNNRSPLVDYPQLLDRITSISQNSVAPENPSVDFPQSGIDYGIVFGNSDVDFFFVIVNNGNTDIPLTDFTAGDPQLSFAGGSGADLNLSPGEAHTVVVRLNMAPNSSLNSFFSVHTGDAKGIVQIPVEAVSEGPNALEILPTGSLEAYPNPSTDILQIEWEGMPHSSARNTGRLRMLGLDGTEILRKQVPAGENRTWVNTEEITPGIYLLSIEFPGYRAIGKVVISR